MEITDCSEDFNTLTVRVTNSAIGLSHSSKDVPCLVDPPEHNWYDLNWQYKKCSKCGMSYEKPADKDFHLTLKEKSKQ